MTDFQKLIERLVDADVRFIIVGGFAGTVHGSARSTRGLDIVYQRSAENMMRLVRALEPYRPYPRGAPPGLPFRWDSHTLRLGLNFTLQTSAGLIDTLGEIAGGGYDNLLPHTVEVTVFDRKCRCLDLPTLIKTNRAAGRPKDFDALAELESIAKERQKSQQERTTDGPGA